MNILAAVATGQCSSTMSLARRRRARGVRAALAWDMKAFCSRERFLDNSTLATEGLRVSAVHATTSRDITPRLAFMPLLLALDTSAAASLAVVDDGITKARWSTAETTSHAEVLAPAVDRVLSRAGVSGKDLDAVVVGVGPGPFTGLRTGLITAETLAFVWGVPAYGVGSLDALARTASRDANRCGTNDFVVALDARRREVYWAHYRQIDGEAICAYGPVVSSPSEVLPFPAYGAGAGLYREQLDAVAGWAEAVPDGAAIGEIAEAALQRGGGLLPLEPLYLREPDARVPGPGKRVST